LESAVVPPLVYYEISEMNSAEIANIGFETSSRCTDVGFNIVVASVLAGPRPTIAFRYDNSTVLLFYKNARDFILWH
jgi:hypothetical protein